MLNLFEILLPLIAVALVIMPLYFVFKKGLSKQSFKRRLISQISVFVGVFTILLFTAASKAYAASESSELAGTLAQGLGFIAAAMSTSFSSLGAGIAVSSAASSAIGAISENSENFGKAMIFVVLGEGVAIYGLLISILIINKL